MYDQTVMERKEISFLLLTKNKCRPRSKFRHRLLKQAADIDSTHQTEQPRDLETLPNMHIWIFFQFSHMFTKYLLSVQHVRSTVYFLQPHISCFLEIFKSSIILVIQIQYEKANYYKGMFKKLTIDNETMIQQVPKFML